MPTPFESAQLNLQLYDLRREPLLREARAWFLNEFHPQTLDELVEVLRGERNAWFRMVIGYWDMAASLVTTQAIDADSFCAPHTARFSARSARWSPLLQLSAFWRPSQACFGTSRRS